MTRLPSESAGPRGQLWTAALVALWEQRRGSRPREGAARDPRGASERPAARGTPSPGLHDGASPPSGAPEEPGGGHVRAAVRPVVLPIAGDGIALGRPRADPGQVPEERGGVAHAERNCKDEMGSEC